MKKQILLVEDTLPVREEIYDILIMEDYEVILASNGIEGLKLAQKNKPQLILSDIVMPEMGGFEMYDNIVKNPEIKNIPVVFLSAKADKDAIEKAKELGSGEYILKPVDPDILIDIINKQIH